MYGQFCGARDSVSEALHRVVEWHHVYSVLYIHAVQLLQRLDLDVDGPVLAAVMKRAEKSYSAWHALIHSAACSCDCQPLYCPLEDTCLVCSQPVSCKSDDTCWQHTGVMQLHFRCIATVVDLQTTHSVEELSVMLVSMQQRRVPVDTNGIAPLPTHVVPESNVCVLTESTPVTVTVSVTDCTPTQANRPCVLAALSRGAYSSLVALLAHVDTLLQSHTTSDLVCAYTTESGLRVDVTLCVSMLTDLFHYIHHSVKRLCQDPYVALYTHHLARQHAHTQHSMFARFIEDLNECVQSHRPLLGVVANPLNHTVHSILRSSRPGIGVQWFTLDSAVSARLIADTLVFLSYTQEQHTVFDLRKLVLVDTHTGTANTLTPRGVERVPMVSHIRKVSLHSVALSRDVVHSLQLHNNLNSRKHDSSCECESGAVDACELCVYWAFPSSQPTPWRSTDDRQVQCVVFAAQYDLDVYAYTRTTPTATNGDSCVLFGLDLETMTYFPLTTDVRLGAMGLSGGNCDVQVHSVVHQHHLYLASATTNNLPAETDTTAMQRREEHEALNERVYTRIQHRGGRVEGSDVTVPGVCVWKVDLFTMDVSVLASVPMMHAHTLTLTTQPSPRVLLVGGIYGSPVNNGLICCSVDAVTGAVLDLSPNCRDYSSLQALVAESSGHTQAVTDAGDVRHCLADDLCVSFSPSFAITPTIPVSAATVSAPSPSVALLQSVRLLDQWLLQHLHTSSTDATSHRVMVDLSSLRWKHLDLLAVSFLTDLIMLCMASRDKHRDMTRRGVCMGGEPVCVRIRHSRREDSRSQIHVDVTDTYTPVLLQLLHPELVASAQLESDLRYVVNSYPHYTYTYTETTPGRLTSRGDLLDLLPPWLVRQTMPTHTLVQPSCVSVSNDQRSVLAGNVLVLGGLVDPGHLTPVCTESTPTRPLVDVGNFVYVYDPTTGITATVRCSGGSVRTQRMSCYQMSRDALSGLGLDVRLQCDDNGDDTQHCYILCVGGQHTRGGEGVYQVLQLTYAQSCLLAARWINPHTHQLDTHASAGTETHVMTWGPRTSVGVSIATGTTEGFHLSDNTLHSVEGPLTVRVVCDDGHVDVSRRLFALRCEWYRHMCVFHPTHTTSHSTDVSTHTDEGRSKRPRVCQEVADGLVHLQQPHTHRHTTATSTVTVGGSAHTLRTLLLNTAPPTDTVGITMKDYLCFQ